MPVRNDLAFVSDELQRSLEVVDDRLAVAKFLWPKRWFAKYFVVTTDLLAPSLARTTSYTAATAERAILRTHRRSARSATAARIGRPGLRQAGLEDWPPIARA